MKLLHPLQIGPYTLAGNLFLAPMAGFSDAPFREICRREGASLTYTEMISAEALYRQNPGTTPLLIRTPAEHDVYTLQLFTGNTQSAARGADCIKSSRPLIIDLNCGCPVPKVVKTGAGSALMQNPPAIAAIVKAINATADFPVTVKLRSGWDHSRINYRECADAAVSAGAAAVALHPRTRSQGYSGKAEWEHIAHLVEAVPVPVIGSGDLYTQEDIYRMLSETGCAACMPARGAIGNPFLFRAAGGKTDVVSVEERVKTIHSHLALASRYLGPERAAKEMKKHLCAYTRGFPHSAKIRQKIVTSRRIEDYYPILEEFSKTGY